MTLFALAWLLPIALIFVAAIAMSSRPAPNSAGEGIKARRRTYHKWRMGFFPERIR